MNVGLDLLEQDHHQPLPLLLQQFICRNVGESIQVQHDLVLALNLAVLQIAQIISQDAPQSPILFRLLLGGIGQIIVRVLE